MDISDTNSSSGPVVSLTGNTGGTVVPTAGNIDVIGDDGLTTVGSGSTLTITPRGPGTNTMILGQLSGSSTATGGNNVGYGSRSMSQFNSSAASNTAVGANALSQLISGSNNTVIGVAAGTGYSSSESNNILVANGGSAAESNVIRIGTNQTSCYIGGMYGGAPSSALPVVVNSTGFTGTMALTGLFLGNGSSSVTAITPANNGVLISSNAGVPSFLADGTTGQILTATTGSPPSWENAPASGVTTIDGTTGSITGSTVTITGQDGMTTSCSGTTMTVTPRGPGTDTMYLGQSAGNSSANGGSNVALGALAMTTATNAATQNVAVGTSALNACGASSQSVVVGDGAALFGVCTQDVVMGYNAFAGSGSFTSSGDNVVIGSSCLPLGTTSGSNVYVGAVSGTLDAAASENTILGFQNSTSTTSSQQNVMVGSGLGSSYTSNESNNILIGVGIGGTVGESGVMRLGTANIGNTYIGGVHNTSNLTATLPVVITSTGEMGTTTGTIGSWVSVTGSTQALAVATGYVTNQSLGVVYTLPSTALLGAQITILGKAGIWSIHQNANQSIQVGSSTTTVGTGGSVTAGAAWNCITLQCITNGTSTLWTAFPYEGTLTIV